MPDPRVQPDDDLDPRPSRAVSEPDGSEPDLSEAKGSEATLPERAAPEARDQAEPAPAGDASAWRQLRIALTAPRRTQFVIAAVACVVALAVVWQIRSQGDDEMYRTARRADLIQLVDGLSEETRRLESELNELEQIKRDLESGNDARRVARDQTQRRLDALSVLAGTAPATGPGIRMTISDPQRKLGPSVLLDAMGEMRDAGGEVMEFNDTIRVTASTWVGGSPGRLIVDGTRLPETIVLEVIGDPHSLEEAARFRGGLASEVTSPQVGGRIDIVQLPHLDIQSVRTPAENVHARPAD
ncbi:DUF881 domain-containing protein [Granulicoccus sp. GXG6511]|uniref:DUF881 domain-containing protein n=1 Tax=Granulicoccus sp. GXG6511 TaxID=3381351 RepID=UPI003D7EDC24